jgi:hypothetical protein
MAADVRCERLAKHFHIDPTFGMVRIDFVSDSIAKGLDDGIGYSSLRNEYWLCARFR